MVSTTQNSSARTGSVGGPSIAPPSYSGHSPARLEGLKAGRRIELW